jgi:hypothetical protein
VLKSNSRLEGDHVTHLWGWVEKPIIRNSSWKCLYVDDTIKGGLMMWVASVMDGNKQERKWLIIERKALKWVNVNSAPPTGSP